MDVQAARLFDSLRDEAITLHVGWKLYRRLYAGSSEDVVLLNKSGSSIFRMLQFLLFDDCLLRLCRLTDPASSGPYKYRSIRQLVSALRDVDASIFECDLGVAVRELEAACSEIRTLRNARIAHSDLEHSLEISASPLPGISIKDVDHALRLLSKLLNHIEVPMRRSRTYYGDILVPVDADSERLLSLLRSAHGQHTGA